MSLSEDIKSYALEIGYDHVGITNADKFPGYLEELRQRYAMYRFAIEGNFQLLNAYDPQHFMPNAKSIVVVAYDYFKEAFPDELVNKIGRYYLSRCYPSKRFSIIEYTRRQLMKEFLEKAGCGVNEKAMLPDRQVACRAGIGDYGKNGFIYANNGSSFMTFFPFLVDVELNYDQPSNQQNCPDGCSLCLDACPTGALYEPYRIDPRKCITLNNISNGREAGLPNPIPTKIREKMGISIHGCDICQEVCPRNQRSLKAKLAPDAFLHNIAKGIRLKDILNMDEEYFAERIQPLVYNYLLKKKYIQRNAAIAMGNMADPESIPDLTQALQDKEEMVRAYAAWALGRIGELEAHQSLEMALPQESSEWVISEIKEAMGQCSCRCWYYSKLQNGGKRKWS